MWSFADLFFVGIFSIFISTSILQVSAQGGDPHNATLISPCACFNPNYAEQKIRWLEHGMDVDESPQLACVMCSLIHQVFVHFKFTTCFRM